MSSSIQTLVVLKGYDDDVEYILLEGDFRTENGKTVECLCGPMDEHLWTTEGARSRLHVAIFGDGEGEYKNELTPPQALEAIQKGAFLIFAQLE